MASQGLDRTEVRRPTYPLQDHTGMSEFSALSTITISGDGPRIEAIPPLRCLLAVEHLRLALGDLQLEVAAQVVDHQGGELLVQAFGEPQ